MNCHVAWACIPINVLFCQFCDVARVAINPIYIYIYIYGLQNLHIHSYFWLPTWTNYTNLAIYIYIYIPLDLCLLTIWWIHKRVILKVNLGFNLSFTFNPQFHPQLLVTCKLNKLNKLSNPNFNPKLGINETWSDHHPFIFFDTKPSTPKP